MSDYPDAPKVIQFETNLSCGAGCTHCPQQKAKRECTVMPDSVWRKIVDETRGLGITYRPFMLNEPFTDPRMTEIVRYIKQDPTARVELHTNGSALTEDIAEELIAAEVDAVRFSIDGYHSWTLAQSRPALDQFDVHSNAHRFLRLADGCVDIEVRAIAEYLDNKEREIYRSHWTGQGANVVFTSLYRWPWEGQTEAIRAPCPKIRDEMFVSCDGQVVLCCWDVQARASVGNVEDDAVLDIWNGPPLKCYRRLLDKGHREWVTLCSRCDAYKHLEVV